MKPSALRLLIILQGLCSLVYGQGTKRSDAIQAGTYTTGSIVFNDARNNDPANGYGNDTGNPSDDIYYRFTLNNPAQYSISTCGSNFNTYIQLLDAGGNELFYNNNGGPVCPGSSAASMKGILNAGTYFVVVEGWDYYYGNISFQLILSAAPSGTSQVSYLSNTRNFIATYTPRLAGIGNLGGRAVGEVNQQVQYFDGIGRPIQTVQTKASASQRDLVLPAAYDENGREIKKYLPYTATTGNSNGSYKTSAISDQASFYNDPGSWSAPGVVQIASGQAPYFESRFETSPLARVLEQASPGSSWKMGAGHTTGTSSGTNGSSDVRKWVPSGTGANGTTYYAAGSLYKTVFTDENGRQSIEFKDKEGRVIEKRSQGPSSTWPATAYVYDEFGNLAFVIPPGVTATSFTDASADYGNFIYAYQYDHRNRLAAKKIPGKGWEKLVYNKLDQLVLSQDAIQSSSNKWTFTKYDALGRVIMTGEVTDTRSQTQLTSDLQSQTHHWEEFNASLSEGYTGNSFPTSWNHLYTVNYYDAYSFPNHPGSSYNSTVSGLSSRTRGLLTASKVRNLETGAMLWTLNYYDEDGRPAENIVQNHIGGTDRVISEYDFAGAVTKSTRTHNSSSVSNLAIVNEYKYDHAGRKTESWEKIASGSRTLLSRLDYNETGQLWKKHLEANAGADATLDGSNSVASGHTQTVTASNSITMLPGFEVQSGAVFHGYIQSAGSLQTVEYVYNPRGWVKEMNAPFFSEHLNYDVTYHGATAQYNGNIGEQEYISAATGGQYITYGYDELNRLTSGTSSAGFSETGITYDVMGNILTLNRDGAGSSTYSYTGNQLSTISGGSVSTATGYVYDANGNATTDGRNNRSIGYNYLNLPQSVSGGITYAYDAAGNKLKKVNTSSGITTHYVRGIQYNGGTIDFIQTEEGIARNNSGAYRYEYNLEDHLGNTRLTFYTNPSSGVTEPLQQDNYYPFGKQLVVSGGTNKYLYNGKEVQEELGQYDYGLRHYDPVIGRWLVPDPMAEKYFGWSPYNYVLNNPILFIDPDGSEVDLSYIYEKDKKGNYKNAALVKAFETFAGSKEGIAFLSNFAKKGQVIAGHEYKEGGKYDSKGIDLNFGQLDKNDFADARTTTEVKGDDLEITIKLSGTGTKVDSYIGDIGHEAFAHAEMNGRDFYDNKKLDLSSVDKDIVKYVNDAIKKGYPEGLRSNLAHHTQESRYKLLEQKLVPILKEYYKSRNINKSAQEIRKEVNSYMK